MNDYQDHIELLKKYVFLCDVLRSSWLPKIKHYQKITARCKDSLTELLPEYTIYLGKNACEHPEVTIWGNGIQYNDRLYVSVWMNAENPTWQEAILWDIDRSDPSDKLERLIAEEAMVTEFEELNKQVEVAREAAKFKISQLTIPKSAKIRTDSCHWNNASYELQDRFPLLFK